MKKKLIDAGLFLFLCVIWLFPRQMQPREWAFAAAAVVSYVLLRLIPWRGAAFGAVAAVTAGMSLFDVSYFVCFAPGMLACAALFAASDGDLAQPAKKDGVFMTAAAAAAGSAFGSVLYSLLTLRRAPFQKTGFERYYVYMIIAAVWIAVLLVLSVRTQKSAPAARGKAKSVSYVKCTAAYAVMLASFLSVFPACLKQSASAAVILLPVLACAYAALTVRTPAAGLFVRP